MRWTRGRGEVRSWQVALCLVAHRCLLRYKCKVIASYRLLMQALACIKINGSLKLTVMEHA